MIDLTNLKCVTHPNSKITGCPEWFPVGDGWTFDAMIDCSEQEMDRNCEFEADVRLYLGGDKFEMVHVTEKGTS